LYPGGVKFISHDSEDVISRAAAKIGEALHCLTLYRPLPPAEARWLELGAAPGGMTSELLKHGYHVTAVDSGLMDQRIRGHKNLTFVRTRVGSFEHDSPRRFHALLCDMNGEPLAALAEVIRLADTLMSKGLIIFTLKLPRIENLDEPLALLATVQGHILRAGLHLIAARHLPSNRNELTLFIEKK
jgi:23S rRNA C2498 (ribose-2'-O)-methylase RlmM